MKKTVAAIGVACLFLSACSNPKSKVIPSDPQKWDQITELAKKLSDDDKKELTGYMMRMTLASAFGGNKGTIPPGVTIGEAIDQQKEWEAKQKADEAQAGIIKAKLDAEHNQQVARLTQAATVVLTNMIVLPKNYDAGRFSDRLQLVLGVANHSPKALSGIKGQLIFKDQFGADISRISLSLDEDVAPNATRAISGYGKDINQFEASDTKLAVTPLAKMHVAFEPQMIVYADGSKLAAPDAPSD